MRPAIILTSDFVISSKQSYENYIKYLNREGVQNKNDSFEVEHDFDIHQGRFDGYLKYLAREKAKNKLKTTNNTESLFDDMNYRLNRTERLNVQKKFREAQKNGSVLWRDVYSFDNEWLEKRGLLENGILKEQAVKDAVRSSMNECFELENLKGTGFWVAEIHYNTDNIHVHVASSETHNTREVVKYERYVNGEKIIFDEPKGKRKKRTQNQMKSVFANNLIDRNLSLDRISELRKELHHNIDIDNTSFEQTKRLLVIQKELPDDLSKWQYNNKMIKSLNLQAKIDEYTHHYMNEHHKEEFNEYKRLIKEESELNKELYGGGDKQKDRYKNSETYKMNDLNSKMGNALLSSLKEVEKERRVKYKDGIKNRNPTLSSERNSECKNNYKSKHIILSKRELNRIDRAFRDARKDRELEIEHLKLQQRIERDNEIEL